MEKVTHDGRIKTDELFSPGYVWFSCAAYGLPCNTTDPASGWHCTYRPLCGNQYTGNELVTPEMQQAVREHYAQVKADAELERSAREETEMAAYIAYGGTKENSQVCPKCGTYCYGDCEAADEN